jgi:NAD(P)-dependent dehydrogenase (short-subunit alcohol dehydrogenase family)
MKNKKYNHLLLENKVCVITGAASLRSIGYATAEIFAAHGAKLVLLDLLMNDIMLKLDIHLKSFRCSVIYAARQNVIGRLTRLLLSLVLSIA